HWARLPVTAAPTPKPRVMVSEGRRAPAPVVALGSQARVESSLIQEVPTDMPIPTASPAKNRPVYSIPSEVGPNRMIRLPIADPISPARVTGLRPYTSESAAA